MDVALPVDPLLIGGDNSLVAPTPQFQHESQLANVAAGSAASHLPPTQPTLVGAITDPVVIPDSALDVRALVSSHLQSEVEAFSASILANCSPGITKLVENIMVNTIVQVNAKVEAVDDKVDALDTKVAAMAAQNESNFKQVFAKLEALSIEHSPNAQSQNNGKSNSGKGWSSSPPSFSPPASSGGLSGDGAGIAFGNKSQGFSGFLITLFCLRIPKLVFKSLARSFCVLCYSLPKTATSTKMILGSLVTSWMTGLKSSLKSSLRASPPAAGPLQLKANS